MTYSLSQELLISNLTKEKIRDLHDELSNRKSLLSNQQRSELAQELRSYQELLYQNRLNRQIELR
jgi:hypothetical protein